MMFELCNKETNGEIMKKHIISAVVIVLGIGLSACKKEVKFVDEIFYNPLESLSGNMGTITLTPTREISKLGDNIFYTDCNLLENREGYLKFECGPDYEYREPKPKNYRMDFVIYEVVPSNFSFCRYKVRRTDIWRNTGRPSLISFYCVK